MSCFDTPTISNMPCASNSLQQKYMRNLLEDDRSVPLLPQHHIPTEAPEPEPDNNLNREHDRAVSKFLFVVFIVWVIVYLLIYVKLTQ